MIRLLCLLSLIFVITPTFGQKKNPNEQIKINSKFTFRLQTIDSLKYGYSLIDLEDFNETINLFETDSLFDCKIKEDEVHGIFTNGKFGDKCNNVLILKSGLPESLDYVLKIKTSKKRKPIETSVVSLHPHVLTTEFWPYKIDHILFSKFREITPVEPEYVFSEPTIDSTCIKNEVINIDSLFSDYLDTLKSNFIQSKGLQLETVLKYEQNIDSKDITRDYMTGIGEGIYPNKNGFQLEKPIRYKFIECPYFQRNLGCYFTEKDNSVKVLLFEWNEFKMIDSFLADEMALDLRRKVFREKFNSLAQQLTSLLGKPIEIALESEDKPNYFRDDMLWENNEGIHAYLFMFGNDDNNFRQIRLALYKD